jgi:hypothetical protein
MNVKVYNPLNRPVWMSSISNLIPPHVSRKEVLERTENGDTQIAYAQRMVRSICLRYVHTCDFIVCYLNDTKTYGTTEELVIASHAGKPIILICDCMPSLWLFDVLRDAHQFDRLDGAMEFLKSIDDGRIKLDALRWIFLGDDYELEPIMYHS